MTPKEYIEIEKAQREIIEGAKRRIAQARAQADKCPVPVNLRPAKASDITEGAIIWYPEWAKADSGWAVVAEPLHSFGGGDPWKAYRADDGCRYGLRDAFVEP